MDEQIAYDAVAYRFVQLMRRDGFTVGLGYRPEAGYLVVVGPRSRITARERALLRDYKGEIVKVLLKEGDPSLG